MKDNMVYKSNKKKTKNNDKLKSSFKQISLLLFENITGIKISLLLLFIHPYYTSNAFSFYQQLKSLVNLIESNFMRHKLVQVKLLYI